MAYAYSETGYPSRLAYNIVDAIIGIIEMVLGLRLALLFLGANPSAGFVQWLFSVTDGLMRPFIGMFPAWTLGAGYILDFSTLAAMVAYGILGWLITYIISFLIPPITVVDTRRTI